jgi:hypothetical protein
MSASTSPVTRHGHRHPHQHPHPHTHPHEPEPVPSAAGSVVLDIGPGAGAAVVLTPPAMCGDEIEIRPAGSPWDGTHMAVRRRDGAGTPQYAAIFGSLPEGGYEFRVRGESTTAPVLALHVDEASVALAHWPDGERER